MSAVYTTILSRVHVKLLCWLTRREPVKRVTFHPDGTRLTSVRTAGQHPWCRNDLINRFLLNHNKLWRNVYIYGSFNVAGNLK